jgi:hypothetical protein
MISVQGEEAVLTNGLRGTMAHAQEWRIQTMADSKNDPRNSRVTDKNDEKPTGYKSGGGNMGAGKSGKENLGSEKPTDDENMGSQKPGDGSKK